MIGKFTQQVFEDISGFMDNAKQSADASFSREQLKSVVERALKRLDLVTREEFDAQQAVLLRTREKLEALESQMSEMEARLKSDAGQ